MHFSLKNLQNVNSTRHLNFVLFRFFANLLRTEFNINIYCKSDYYESADHAIVTQAQGVLYTMLVPINKTVLNSQARNIINFLTTYIFFTRLTSVGYENPVCHESLLTSFTFMHAWYACMEVCEYFI